METNQLVNQCISFLCSIDDLLIVHSLVYKQRTESMNLRPWDGPDMWYCQHFFGDFMGCTIINIAKHACTPQLPTATWLENYEHPPFIVTYLCFYYLSLIGKETGFISIYTRRDTDIRYYQSSTIYVHKTLVATRTTSKNLWQTLWILISWESKGSWMPRGDWSPCKSSWPLRWWSLPWNCWWNKPFLFFRHVSCSPPTKEVCW